MRAFFCSSLMLAMMCAFAAKAQQPIIPGNPVTLQNAPQRDTSNRSNSAHWRDEPVRIFKTRAFSEVRFYPDSNLHNFQHRPFVGDWNRDLGNLGTAAQNQVFAPENLGNTGPSLGYHVLDIYRFKADSLQYYNTTRPYTAFSYQLGSKLEQTLRLLHTQNIKPNWNFAAQYQKIGSQGFYKLQRTSHDAGALTTHYKSTDQHYELFGALVYNKEQTDENGGILGDTLLDVAKYSDRQTIPVALDNPYYTRSSSAGRRSAITNVDRDFNFLLQHQYTLGKRDTIYNADSTQYAVNLIPRFSLRHRLEAGSEKHTFKDVAPESSVYYSFFQRDFSTYDSVYSQQNWTWIDNQFSLNGFLGAKESPLAVSAGIGSRVDNFYTNYLAGKEANNIISTYLIGDVSKEAISENSWAYDAHAKFVISGSAIGDFLLKGNASKDFGKTIGKVSIGALQQLTEAPYAYTIFQNQYFDQKAALNKESTTLLYATVSNARFGLEAGIKNYVIGNYIFLKDSLNGLSNGRLQTSQNSGAFNLTQVSLRKVFRFGHFVSDNNFVFQQVTGSAPVSVPTLLGRNSLSIETYLFGRSLKVATGAEVRYHTRYNAAGYSPFYNRFYYQDTYTAENKPELNLFFNFKIKRFRAYLMADQLQTLWWRNTVIHPNYASPDLMLRFGFDWVLVN